MVVFPLVPVIPTSVMRSDGRPKNAAETGPIASRTDRTTTWAAAGASTVRSTTRTVAPRPTASGANVVPVLPAAGDAEEQGARPDVARAIGEAPHDGPRVADQLRVRAGRGEERVQRPAGVGRADRSAGHTDSVREAGSQNPRRHVGGAGDASLAWPGSP